MRMDVIWSGMTDEYIKIGDAGSLGQMYPSCAQLNIVSDSATSFPKGVKIPEIFGPYAPGKSELLRAGGEDNVDSSRNDDDV